MSKLGNYFILLNSLEWRLAVEVMADKPETEDNEMLLRCLLQMGQCLRDAGRVALEISCISNPFFCLLNYS